MGKCSNTNRYSRNKDCRLYLMSSIESSDTVSFVIPPMQKYMLDRVEVVTEIRVLTADGGNPEEKNCVSTSPHLAAILWRNVDINVWMSLRAR